MSFEFIFCIGGPGAGKSTIYNIMFSATHALLDSDVIKSEHEKYKELMETEEGVETLHLWARPRLAQRVKDELAVVTKILFS